MRKPIIVLAALASLTFAAPALAHGHRHRGKQPPTAPAPPLPNEPAPPVPAEPLPPAPAEPAPPVPKEPLPPPVSAAAPRLLVPAYFEPEGSPNPWQTMCAEMPLGSTAIANPYNGPGSAAQSDYSEAIANCQADGQKVIGYVETGYGARNLSEVEAQIADWYAWYPALNGIFLDEMPEEPDEAYYSALESYVHERGGIVVGNPGETASNGWQLNVADQVVTFEGTASEFATYEPAPWVLAAEPSRIANIVFEAEATVEACSRAEEDNAGSVYVTSLGEPNPYEALPLPAYWLSETERC